MKKILLFLLLYFVFISILFCQKKVQIEIADLNYQNNELIITYSILNAQKNDKFNIWVELKDKDEQIIRFSKIEGDVGKGISKYQDNTITCNFVENNIYVNTEVGVQILGDYSYANTNLANTMFFSLLFPGLGKYKFNYNKAFLLIGFSAYACVSSSLYYDFKYKQNYNFYLLENNIEKRNNYFEKSIRQYKMSNYFLGAAISIWSIDIISSVFLLYYYKNKSKTAFNNKYNIGIEYNSYAKKPILSFKYYF